MEPAALDTKPHGSDRSLQALSFESPILVVFVRHFGCTFCREMLSDLAAARPQLERHGVRPVVVHMGTPEQAAKFLPSYRLGDVLHVSDPGRKLYAAFGLHRGSPSSFLNFETLKRSVQSFAAGHFQGIPVGDPFQLPGVFLVKDGEIAGSFVHERVSDRPDFCELAGVGN